MQFREVPTAMGAPCRSSLAISSASVRASTFTIASLETKFSLLSRLALSRNCEVKCVHTEAIVLLPRPPPTEAPAPKNAYAFKTNNRGQAGFEIVSSEPLTFPVRRRRLRAVRDSVGIAGRWCHPTVLIGLWLEFGTSSPLPGRAPGPASATTPAPEWLPRIRVRASIGIETARGDARRPPLLAHRPSAGQRIREATAQHVCLPSPRPSTLSPWSETDAG